MTGSNLVVFLLQKMREVPSTELNANKGILCYHHARTPLQLHVVLLELYLGVVSKQGKEDEELYWTYKCV